MTIANAKSKGYYKIKDASNVFNFDFNNKTVLDIGSSTGGFTEYALEHGAKKVIAIEKGTNQMKSPLRNNSRVELHEKTDIFNFSSISEVILADVSFISLRKILLYAKHHLSNSDTEFLVMLKPQFEAEPHQLINGIVKNAKIRRCIIKDFEQWLKNNRFIIFGKYDNKIKGKFGNQEKFYYLKLEK